MGRRNKKTSTVDQQANPTLKRPHSDNAKESIGAEKQIKLENPNEKNPITVLHEMYPGKIKFIEKETKEKGEIEFEYTVEIEGKIYKKAVAKKKKVAKNLAAEATLQALKQTGAASQLLGSTKKNNRIIDKKVEEVRDMNPKIVSLDDETVEILRLAGLTPVNRYKNLFNCTLCQRKIGPTYEYIRNHILSNTHIPKMADHLHIDVWDEVIKVIQGGDPKTKFPDNLDVSGIGPDLQVMRHIMGRKFFCIACQKILFISTKQALETHLYSNEHITLIEEKGLHEDVPRISSRIAPVSENYTNYLHFEEGPYMNYENESMYQHHQERQDQTSIYVEKGGKESFPILSCEEIIGLAGITQKGRKPSFYCNYCQQYVGPNIIDQLVLRKHCIRKEHLQPMANELDLNTWHKFMF
ncbi:unnamed protein product, partial [Meganyctiphanes norvegica]